MSRPSLKVLLPLLLIPAALASGEDGDEDDDGPEALTPVQSVAGKDLTQAVQDPLLQEALRCLYDLEFEKTHALAFRFIRQHPENPFGHLFAAGALWWEASTGFDASPAGKTSSAMADRFELDIDRTLEKAKKLYKSKDKSLWPDGLFATGMALGLRGQWRLADGEWMQAYRDGKKAIKFLRKCVKMDPSYHDAYLGLGMFDYQTAKLPAILRMGAAILLHGVGDAARGLHRMRMAMEMGRFSSRQAAAQLMTVRLQYEKDYGGALDILRDHLLATFPSSSYFRLIDVALLELSGDSAGSLKAGLSLFDSLRQDPESFRTKQGTMLCGFLGKTCLERERLEPAVRWMDKALAAAENGSSPPGWPTTLHLYRGMAHDLLGQRALARDDYQTVLEHPFFLHSHAWARECLSKPCGRADAVRLLQGEPPASSPPNGFQGPR
ncbi:MAG: hypothetical protein WC728_15100 [Elusimicrobiota bacterium]